VRRISVTRSRQRCHSGAITIEFALVFPILVAFLFGLIDVGRFIAARTMLAQAAAAGARAACLSSTTSASDVTTAARNAAPALGGLTASATCAAACTYPVGANQTVDVAVTYNFVAGFYTSFQKSMVNHSIVTCG
jgi:Flp pilus assembly protein TadG